MRAEARQARLRAHSRRLAPQNRPDVAPPGTAGRAVLFGFHMDDVIAPGNTMIAAEAIIRPSQGLVQVFVLRLGGTCHARLLG